MKNRYPEYILRKLRQREGLKPDDKTLDDKLNSLYPETVFSEVLRWEGIIGYEDFIIELLKDCGFIVKEKDR